MPTNEIAIDCDRLSLQLLKREKRLIGQAAISKGYRSVGEYVRSLIQQGLEIEDPALAERYKAARKLRYIQTLSITLITSVVLWQSVFTDDDLLRSLPGRGLARSRKEEVQ